MPQCQSDQDPSDPTEISRQDVGVGVETLFHYDGGPHFYTRMIVQ